MDVTCMLEGAPTVPNCEIIFEMLVRWLETVFRLAGAWVSQPRHMQGPMGLLLLLFLGHFAGVVSIMSVAAPAINTGPHACGKVKCDADMTAWKTIKK